MRAAQLLRLVALFASLSLVIAGCAGAPAGPQPLAQPTPDMTGALRVPVRMFEMGYEPAEIHVPAGPVIFEVRNDGVVAHEFFVGPESAQQHHRDEMAGGDDEPHHQDVALILGPGESADLPLYFRAAGEMLVGCHVPGHYEAGMKGRIVIGAPAEQ